MSESVINLVHFLYDSSRHSFYYKNGVSMPSFPHYQQSLVEFFQYLEHRSMEKELIKILWKRIPFTSRGKRIIKKMFVNHTIVTKWKRTHLICRMKLIVREVSFIKIRTAYQYEPWWVSGTDDEFILFWIVLNEEYNKFSWIKYKIKPEWVPGNELYYF